MGLNLRVGGPLALLAVLCRVALLGLLIGTGGGACPGPSADHVLQTAGLVLVALSALALPGLVVRSRERVERVVLSLLVLGLVALLVVAAERGMPSVVGGFGPFWLHDAVGSLALGVLWMPVAAVLLLRRSPAGRIALRRSPAEKQSPAERLSRHDPLTRTPSYCGSRCSAAT